MWAEDISWRSNCWYHRTLRIMHVIVHSTKMREDGRWKQVPDHIGKMCRSFRLYLSELSDAWPSLIGLIFYSLSGKVEVRHYVTRKHPVFVFADAWKLLIQFNLFRYAGSRLVHSWSLSMWELLLVTCVFFSSAVWPSLPRGGLMQTEIRWHLFPFWKCWDANVRLTANFFSASEVFASFQAVRWCLGGTVHCLECHIEEKRSLVFPFRVVSNDACSLLTDDVLKWMSIL